MARVLVIDDELDIVRVVVRTLSARGHEVDTGRDGREALPRIEADPPDLLIIDANLPGLDGVELVRRLKASPRTAGVPILLMTTAYLGLDGLGADEYVVKPFLREVLLANVDRLLARA